MVHWSYRRRLALLSRNDLESAGRTVCASIAARYVAAVIRQPPKLTIPRVEFVLDKNDHYDAVQVLIPRSCMKSVAERVPTPALVAAAGPRL